jgi:uncharacterized protein (TIGR04255 family)
MSKLAGAPLQEVITEIRWSLTTEQERNDYQFLTGDLYGLVREKFPHREVVIPAGFPIEVFIGRPALRFRVSENGYPLIQIGPGVLTVNTVGDEYDWDTHSQDIRFVLTNFFSACKLEGKSVNATLAYIDFFEFDFEKSNVLDYLSSLLNTQVKFDFIDTSELPKIFNLTVGYTEQVGIVNVNIARGNNPSGKDGIAIQTNVIMESLEFDQNSIENRLDAAHTWCSELFKKMTKGELYDSYVGKP